MEVDRLAWYSRVMATLTLVFTVSMLLLNFICWIFPIPANQYGLGFSLSLVNDLGSASEAMPWWQVMGGIVLSSIPLLLLARGLNALRCLFRSYGAGDYFSVESAMLLGRVGQGVALWVVSSFLLEPVVSLWGTMLNPVGERMLTLTFDSSHVVALFLAGSVMVIARILGMASTVAAENRQFV